MARKAKKADIAVFKTIFKGCGLYLTNLPKLMETMLFPVLGQMFGIFLVFFLVYNINQWVQQHLSPVQISSNVLLIIMGIIVAALPGMFIFTKAFWEYMIRMVSLNSLAAVIVNKGKLKDTESANQAVKQRSKDYISLLTLISLIWAGGLGLPVLMLIFQGAFSQYPVFLYSIVGFAEVLSIIILIIVSVYLSMTFQVFAFENSKPLTVLKKSWKMVDGNFIKFALFGIILGGITGLVVPGIFQAIFSMPLFSVFITKPVYEFAKASVLTPGNLSQLMNFFNSVGLSAITSSADPLWELSFQIALSIVGITITALLLPLGSICYTILYFDLNDKKGQKKNV